MKNVTLVTYASMELTLQHPLGDLEHTPALKVSIAVLESLNLSYALLGSSQLFQVLYRKKNAIIAKKDTTVSMVRLKLWNAPKAIIVR